MDLEKVRLYLQLWGLGKAVSDGLETLAKNPKDAQTAVDTQAGFQALRAYLSSEVSDVLQRALSEKKSRPEDLLNASKQLLNQLSQTISKDLFESINEIPTVERPEAEKLFLLWDEMPHTNAEAYLWLFFLCEKASRSMPLEAFEYSVRLFEEQPGFLSGNDTPHPGYSYRPSKQRTFEKCPICGGQGTPYFRALSYRMAKFDYPGLPVKLWMKCGGCGNLYTWKFPEEWLKPVEKEQEIRPNPARALTAIEDTNSLILSIWSDILNRLSSYTSGRDLLEVGIGRGEFLAVALEMGYRPDAVELMPESAQKVADVLELPIWCGDFLQYKPDKTYSVIMMGDVIEHVTDPGEALRNAHRLLKDDGVLWLSTPNFESSFSRMRKFSDAMWSEPYHVTYFSRSGLEALAADCGFVLREYRVSNRYSGSMEVIFAKNNHPIEG